MTMSLIMKIEASCASTSTIKTPLVQLPNVKERKINNVAYTLRQEKFNNNFTPKDLLNTIQKIFLSPPRDMSDEKGSLEYLPIYSFLFLNEKGFSLYNAYDWDDPLRAMIDIDASKEDMETASVKEQEVFIRICCSFIRALYRILDCSWKDIFKGLIVTTSTDPSKCSYHILYAPAFLIDHHELKAFTELVYTITGEKFRKFIDQKLPGHNFNLRLIGSAKKGHVKRILKFSLDNGWNKLDHAKVQLPPSLGLEVRPRMLSIEKNNNPLRISVDQDILRKYAELILQKHSSYLRNWTIEEKDSENFVYFNQQVPLGYPLCKRIHDKDQR
ncbi:hypothetical protein C1646_786587 [Rhizophagus diaphanus]|nr:hypothetical protein C1646_786587 [Rhizophagus diaphanus] [Rhizophagus sp. MUCL 43196]